MPAPALGAPPLESTAAAGRCLHMAHITCMKSTSAVTMRWVSDSKAPFTKSSNSATTRGHTYTNEFHLRALQPFRQ